MTPVPEYLIWVVPVSIFAFLGFWMIGTWISLTGIGAGIPNDDLELARRNEAQRSVLQGSRSNLRRENPSEATLVESVAES